MVGGEKSVYTFELSPFALNFVIADSTVAEPHALRTYLCTLHMCLIAVNLENTA